MANNFTDALGAALQSIRESGRINYPWYYHVGRDVYITLREAETRTAFQNWVFFGFASLFLPLLVGYALLALLGGLLSLTLNTLARVTAQVSDRWAALD